MASTGWVTPDSFVVCGVGGRLDARIVTVTTNDDEQQCAVQDDGFIAVLIYAKWGEMPRITVETYSGSEEPG